MKINYLKYFMYVCLGIGWVGCQSGIGDEITETVIREVTFHIGEEEALFTKATAAGFEIGDSIGIYAVKRIDPAIVKVPGQTGNQAHNAKWIKTAQGWQPASLADKIVYPQDGAKLDFYAYYPYRRNATDPENIHFTVKTEQTLENERKGSDLMVAYNKTGKNEGEVDLVFTHALAMVEVNVRSGNTVAPSVGLQMQMAEIMTDMYLNLATDRLSSGNTTGTVSMFRIEEADEVTAFTFRAYIPVQQIPTGVSLFRCLLDGKVYIYKSEAPISLERGNRISFGLSLKAE